MRPPLPHVELPFLLVHGNLIWPLLIAWLTTALLLVRRCAASSLIEETRSAKVFAVLAFCGFSYGVLYGVGQVAQKHFAWERLQPDSISSFSAIGIAASLPGARSEALAHVDSWVQQSPRSRQSLAFETAWNAERGRCSSAPLRMAGELDAALGEALRCGDMYSAMFALYLRGDFYQASSVGALLGTKPDEVAIAVGDWKSIIRNLSLRDETAPEERERTKCLIAVATDYDAGRDPFAADGVFVTHHCARHNFAAGAVLDVRRGAIRDGNFIVTAQGSEVLGSSVFLVPFLAPDAFHTPGPNGTRAVYELLRGDFDAARAAKVTEAPTDPVLMTNFDEVALRHGDHVLGKSDTNAAAALYFREFRTRLDASAPVGVTPETCAAPFTEALDIATVGPATQLTSVVERCALGADARALVMAAAPYIQFTQEHLAELLRYRSLDTAGYSFGRQPLEWLGASAEARDFSILLGDPEAAQAIQQNIDRHLDNLKDTRKATMINLLQGL